MDKTWQALAHEAGIAAEHLAMGVSALGKANYSQHAYYGQAFFALSVGIERASKLALAVDYALNHGGNFPQVGMISAYRHDLRRLLEQTDKIARCRGLTATEHRLPRTQIHDGIINVLSNFSNDLTRYYNLGVITGDQRTAKQDDPVRAWFDLVTVPVLATHLKPYQQRRLQFDTQLVSEMLGDHAMVLYHSERGEVLDTVYEASKQTGIVDFAKPYTRMYVLQIARFLGHLLSELGDLAQVSHSASVPALSEFFEIFNTPDRYFRQRKAWSIYRP